MNKTYSTKHLPLALIVKEEVAYHVNLNYLKIDYHDWMTIRKLFCFLLPSDSNVASVRRSLRRITIRVLSLETRVKENVQ